MEVDASGEKGSEGEGLTAEGGYGGVISGNLQESKKAGLGSWRVVGGWSGAGGVRACRRAGVCAARAEELTFWRSHPGRPCLERRLEASVLPILKSLWGRAEPTQGNRLGSLLQPRLL